MTKAAQLRKKAAELKEQIRRLEADAKKAEEESFTKLGAHTVEFLKNEISIEELKVKAAELGLIDKEKA